MFINACTRLLTGSAIASAAFAWMGASSSAQLPPSILTSQPAELRLWLKADDLVSAGLTDGDPITPGQGWLDASQYGTILAPRTQGWEFGVLDIDGEFGPDGPVEEQPHLEYVNIGGNSVPTVEFERHGPIAGTNETCSHDPCEGDPNIDRSGSADRLYQTNNLDDPDNPGTTFDPLDIGNGMNLVTFVVFQPEDTTTSALGYQTVFAKRGMRPGTSQPVSVYDFKIDSRNPSTSFNNNGRFSFMNIDAHTIYSSGEVATEDVFHITSMQVIDDPADPSNPSNDEVFFLDDDSEDGALRMSVMADEDGNTIYVDSGSPPGSGTFVPHDPALLFDRNDTAIGVPFGIGGHQQLPTAGEGEAFGGNIAELIIFAHDPSDPLSQNEFDDIEDYLNAKYFAAAPPNPAGDFNDDGVVDAADYTVWRDFKDTDTQLPNDNGIGTPVSTFHYQLWETQYGQTASSASATTSIPEPSSIAVLAMGLCAPMMVLRRRAS